MSSSEGLCSFSIQARLSALWAVFRRFRARASAIYLASPSARTVGSPYIRTLGIPATVDTVWSVCAPTSIPSSERAPRGPCVRRCALAAGAARARGYKADRALPATVSIYRMHYGTGATGTLCVVCVRSDLSLLRASSTWTVRAPLRAGRWRCACKRL